MGFGVWGLGFRVWGGGEGGGRGVGEGFKFPRSPPSAEAKEFSPRQHWDPEWNLKPQLQNPSPQSRGLKPENPSSPEFTKGSYPVR